MGNDLRKDYAAIPEYRMADSQAQMYKDLAYFGYRMAGGKKDYYSTYNDGEPIGYNRNPKEIKNNLLFQAIPGGYLNIAETVWGLGHALFTDDSVSESVRVKDIPIVNRFYKQTSPEMYRYNIYKQCRKELQAYEDQKRTLKPQAEGGNTAAAEEMKRLEKEQIGRNIKSPESDNDIRSLKNIMDEYNTISAYRTAKKYGMSTKEYEHLLIEKIGKENAEEQLKHIDETEKNLIREMRQWLIENKGVKLVIDGDGNATINRPKK